MKFVATVIFIEPGEAEVMVYKSTVTV
jgi:hypothetical protein